MNKEIKQKWCVNLKSGKYKKTTGSLKCGDKFCSLGVLCDLYINETGKGSWNELNDDFTFSKENEWIGLLPKEVVEWAEIIKSEIYEFSDFGDTVCALNDGIGCDQKSFEEIADFIEKNF